MFGSWCSEHSTILHHESGVFSLPSAPSHIKDRVFHVPVSLCLSSLCWSKYLSLFVLRHTACWPKYLTHSHCECSKHCTAPEAVVFILVPVLSLFSLLATVHHLSDSKTCQGGCSNHCTTPLTHRSLEGVSGASVSVLSQTGG